MTAESTAAVAGWPAALDLEEVRLPATRTGPPLRAGSLEHACSTSLDVHVAAVGRITPPSSIASAAARPPPPHQRRKETTAAICTDLARVPRALKRFTAEETYNRFVPLGWGHTRRVKTKDAVRVESPSAGGHIHRLMSTTSTAFEVDRWGRAHACSIQHAHAPHIVLWRAMPVERQTPRFVRTPSTRPEPAEMLDDEQGGQPDESWSAHMIYAMVRPSVTDGWLFDHASQEVDPDDAAAYIDAATVRSGSRPFNWTPAPPRIHARLRPPRHVRCARPTGCLATGVCVITTFWKSEMLR